MKLNTNWGANHGTLFFTVLSTCMVRLTLSLSITNVTAPVTLTKIFVGQDNSSDLYNLYDTTLTYYSNPNINTTNTSTFLWYLTRLNINGTNFLKSDIFTSEFTPYSGNNQLPFTISDKAGSPGSLSPSALVCTSPISMDIINCWSNSDEIECKIYFTKNNILSDIIRIKHNTPIDVLCFDDSYFITYFTIVHNENDEYIWTIYGTILDLKGNIVDSDIQLKQLIFPEFDDAVFLFGCPSLFCFVKGGNYFNAQMIDKSANELFKFYFEIEYTNNDTTYIYEIYGYYTSINDTKVPIYIYNDSIIEVKWYNGIHPVDMDILDWTNTCCYVEVSSITNDQDQYQDIYVRITDIFGNKIKINGSNQDSEYISLTKDLSVFIGAAFVDLSVISKTNIHYFMVVGGENNGDVMICDVFYLEFNVSDSGYKLGNVGSFDTAAVIYSKEPNIYPMGFDVFNVPKTNYLFFVWSQQYSNDPNDLDYGYYSVSYGQTWTIN